MSVCPGTLLGFSGIIVEAQTSHETPQHLCLCQEEEGAKRFQDGERASERWVSGVASGFRASRTQPNSESPVPRR